MADSSIDGAWAQKTAQRMVHEVMVGAGISPAHKDFWRFIIAAIDLADGDAAAAQKIAERAADHEAIVEKFRSRDASGRPKLPGE
ncbi:hypothetical protein BTE77_06620 [Ensifer adhaerens]|nr:hypothetical protein BTE77_06620 [Ensifer adhaerens]